MNKVDEAKLLASETRWKILESLKERRKTVTELARELGLATSTVYEHLEKLERAGLVRKIDEGRKWKYYEVVTTRETKPKAVARTLVLVSLIILGLFFVYSGFHPQPSKTQERVGEQAVHGALMKASPPAPAPRPKPPSIDWVSVAIGAFLVLGATLYLALKWVHKQARQ